VNEQYLILAELKLPYFNVVKNLAAREATIYIYGVIGGIDWDTYEEINTAAKFADEFKEVEKDADVIHVRVNSPGGYVFEGLAIYNVLFASEKYIHTYNDGICASMAALILLAGDEIHAFSNSLLMIHNSSSGFYGNKKEVEEQLQASEKIDKALGTAIEARLGITAEEVAETYLNYKDNWFTSDEAKESGFYDTIIQKKKAQVPSDAVNMSPKQLFEKYAAMSFTIPTKNTKPKNKMSKPNSFPNLEATLGLKAPLAVNDNGSYLNEDQKNTIERSLSASATALKNAQDAKATAEAALQTEKDAHQAALTDESGKATALITALKAAATLAGVENIADDATAEAVQTALTAQIEVLNKKPGATHTATGAEVDETDTTPSYVNKEAYANMFK